MAVTKIGRSRLKPSDRREFKADVPFPTQTIHDFKLGDAVVTPTGYLGHVEHVGAEQLAVRYVVHRVRRSAWWPPTKLERVGKTSKRKDLDE